jgi:ribonuclease Z
MARGWLRRVIMRLLILFLGLTVSAVAGGPDLTICLLGTGGPELTPDRQGAATLVEAGQEKLLFDAGRGVMQRLYECRVSIPEVREVFLTHLHSDHIEGLPNLWMSGWFLLGRSQQMTFHGPTGTQAMAKGMEAFFGHDMVTRVQAAKSSEGLKYAVQEFTGDGVVYDHDGVRVIAFQVDHKDGNPAFGFRVENHGRSVVLSGDCTYTRNLVEHARNCDVIVHNVFATSAAIMAKNPVERLVSFKLASPEQVAAVFSETHPRLAALSHVIRIGLKDADLVTRIRAAGYAGPLTVGLDRMVIEVGDSIVVQNPPALDDLPDVAKPGDL